MFENPYDLKNRFKEKYSYERENTQEQDTGEFKRLDDYVAKNPNNERWTWTMQQENVLQAHNNVMNVFNLFLFNMTKPQFAKYCQENNVDVIKNYVDTAIDTSQKYVSPVEKYEEERKNNNAIMAQQAEQIKLLQQQLNVNQKTEVIRV